MTPKATEAGPEMTGTNVTVDFRRFIKDLRLKMLQEILYWRRGAMKS